MALGFKNCFVNVLVLLLVWHVNNWWQKTKTSNYVPNSWTELTTQWLLLSPVSLCTPLQLFIKKSGSKHKPYRPTLYVLTQLGKMRHQRMYFCFFYCSNHVDELQMPRVSHLSEGQAVLVCLLVFELKVVQSFALRRRLRQRLDDLDKVGGEEAVDSAHLAVVPVLVHLPAQDDDVTLAELEVSGFLAVIVVERFGTRELWYTLKAERSRVNTRPPNSWPEVDWLIGHHCDSPVNWLTGQLIHQVTL